MPAKNYTHVFFDLDHTLWDFESNNRLTFTEILSKYNLLKTTFRDVEEFLSVYNTLNKDLWDQYKKGLIVKSYLSYRRFELTLQNFGIENTELAKTMAEDYIRVSPTKTILMEGTIEALRYLKAKYRLGLITNGFDEIQFVKIRHSGLEKYFQVVVTSEEAGSKKPDPDIFAYTLAKAGASKERSIYIGDEPETDVVGAQLAGIDQVLVTFGKPLTATGATYTITTLAELKTIL